MEDDPGTNLSDIISKEEMTKNMVEDLKIELNSSSEVSCKVEWVSSFQSKELMGPSLAEDGCWARVLVNELWLIIKNHHRRIGRVGITELTSDTGEKHFFLVLGLQHLERGDVDRFFWDHVRMLLTCREETWEEGNSNCGQS